MLAKRSLSLVALLATSGLASADVLHVPGDAPTIQAAVDLTQAGDTVVVADGVWTGPGNRDVLLPGWDLVVRSANGPESCMIDVQGTVADPHRAFSVLAGNTRATRIEGFTITGGETLVGAVDSPFNGGGILIENSSPTLADCVFAFNHCSCWGGAVCASFTGSPLIERCLFEGNGSGDEGGAVFCWASVTLEIANSVFLDNVSGNAGGAITGFSTIHGRNLTVVGNQASWGAGVYMNGGTLESCLIWGNEGTSDESIAGWVDSVEYSLVAGGHAGAGNIDVNPKLTADRIHLRLASPCVDAGAPGPAPQQRDIDGQRRRIGLRVDIGADEFMPRPVSYR